MNAVLARVGIGTFDGQRGIDHLRWEIAIKPSSGPMNAVLARAGIGAFDGQRGIDHL